MTQTKVEFSALTGAIIDVDVRLPGAGGGSSSTGQSAAIRLLIDTGARRTHIPAAVAGLVGLPYRGRQPATSATQKLLLDMWSADIFIPSLNRLFQRVPIVDFLQPSINYDGVLGRDILAQGSLIFDGPKGEVNLTF